MICCVSLSPPQLIFVLVIYYPPQLVHVLVALLLLAFTIDIVHGKLDVWLSPMSALLFVLWWLINDSNKLCVSIVVLLYVVIYYNSDSYV